ncbi:MAG: CDP-diacylglycerol--glycerol-3-phosphate 3-phosphatidyltransferase [Gammaproteobacteria bacterium]|nr:CDP-diacylglycerol--glycerol-3-phosphate 3-phosphatidyltransferase [Gammaproteobacteria bacterium]
MNIPNQLTLLRIALIPCFVAVFYLPVDWSRLVATLLFSLAAITDWLDGYLARRLQQQSALGAFLDPVADKLMVAVVLIVLVQQDPTLWMVLPAAVIIGREITISALREWMAQLGARSKVAVSVLGKVKTIAQMTALICMLLADSLGFIDTYFAGFLLLYLAATLTLWSMCQYLLAAWPELRASRDGQGGPP